MRAVLSTLILASTLTVGCGYLMPAADDPSRIPADVGPVLTTALQEAEMPPKEATVVSSAPGELVLSQPAVAQTASRSGAETVLRTWVEALSGAGYAERVQPWEWYEGTGAKARVRGGEALIDLHAIPRDGLPAGDPAAVVVTLRVLPPPEPRPLADEDPWPDLRPLPVEEALGAAVTCRLPQDGGQLLVTLEPGGDLVGPEVTGTWSTGEGLRIEARRGEVSVELALSGPLRAWQQREVVYVAGPEGHLRCTRPATGEAPAGVLPWVLVVDAGGGPAAVQDVARVAHRTHEPEQPALLVVQGGSAGEVRGGIRIAHRPAAEHDAGRLVAEVERDLPAWRVTSEVAPAAPAPILVEVGGPTR